MCLLAGVLQFLISPPPLQLHQVSQLKGWFPIYDSLNGIRGELSVTVRRLPSPLEVQENVVRFFAIPWSARVCTRGGGGSSSGGDGDCVSHAPSQKHSLTLTHV